MSTPDPDECTRRPATESLDTDDPTGWFESLYAAAEAGEIEVPWDRGTPHSMLVEWADTRAADGTGRRALVVGCGLGRDSEYMADLGYDTVAFDVSPSAVASARRRFPDSPVRYVTANLLDLPEDWNAGFDLVVESMTIQSLPVDVRRPAVLRVGPTVAPGGTLLVIAAARDEADAPRPGPPWPLTRDEIDAFATEGLRPVLVEDVRDQADPTLRRWRAEFHRPSRP